MGAQRDLTFMGVYLSRPEHSQNILFIIVIGGAGGRNCLHHFCLSGVVGVGVESRDEKKRKHVEKSTGEVCVCACVAVKLG